MKLAQDNAIDAVVIDPISDYLARLEYIVRVVQNVKREFGRAAREVDDHIRPYLWQVNDALARVERPAAGTRGVLLVVIGHERDPIDIDGRHTRGGMRAPGQVAHQLRYQFDVMLRCVPRMLDGVATACFSHDRFDESEYPTKDRFNIVSDRSKDGVGLTPMDVSALLRTVLRKQFGLAALAEDAEALRLGRVVSVAKEGAL